MNEPACYSGYSNFAMEWVTKPDDVDRIRVIANIHYSDNVVGILLFPFSIGSV